MSISLCPCCQRYIRFAPDLLCPLCSIVAVGLVTVASLLLGMSVGLW